MSEFLSKVHRLAASMGKHRPTPQDEREIEMGRVLATQFIDALRGGDKTPDALMLAVALAGQAGGETVRGFCREVSDALLEGR